MWRRVVAFGIWVILAAACTSERLADRMSASLTDSIEPSPQGTRTPDRSDADRRLARAWASRSRMTRSSSTRIASFTNTVHLSDISPDGLNVSFFSVRHLYEDDETWVLGILHLLTGEIREIARVGPLYDDETYIRVGDAVFSPSGEEVLFQDGHNLRVGEIASGRTFVVARTINAYDIGYRWLSDGRIAYVAHGRRLMFVLPGTRPAFSGFRFVNPSREDDVLRSWDIDPTGSRLLYVSGCGTWLRNLETGRSRFLRAGVEAVPRRSWSPDGRLFVLQSGSSYGTKSFNRVCASFDRPWLLSDHDFLFTRDGEPLTPGKTSLMGHGPGHSHGHTPSWSLDSKWLLFAFQPTGSCVIDFKSLVALHVDSKKESTVISQSLTGRALAGRDGKLVYALWDRVGTVCDASPDDYSSGVYVATIEK